MTVLGFDFGTTNSLMAVIEGGRAINLFDSEDLPVPSVVSYEGSQIVVGREAKKRLVQAGLGIHGNTVRSPKTLLGKEEVVIGGVERDPVDIVAEVVRCVRKMAKEHSVFANSRISLDANRAVVTIPVNMDGNRRALLRDACRKAGVSVVQFVHEPLAALYGYFRQQADYRDEIRRFEGKLVLVFDWGGGTLDLTLCRVLDDRLIQIGNDGTDEVGGDVFDEEIRNEIERLVREQRQLGSDVPVLPGAKTRLMAECERSKIDLSSKDSVAIFVNSFFDHADDASLDYSLSRDVLESIVNKLVAKGIGRIEALLEREGYSFSSVAMCLATGGMANMPIIRKRLHQIFGPARVNIPEGSASVIAQGAAWVAHDNAQLMLAKNVELVLARNSYLPLLKSGLAMPRENEVKSERFDLFCVDPTDGKGKFQLTSPHRPGDKVSAMDVRRPLANLVIDVDSKARPFRERLHLQIKVDENLILTAEAFASNKMLPDKAEVYDLEFALSLPKSSGGAMKQGDDVISVEERKMAPGTLVVRSNIADKEDLKLVPGEVLYEYNKEYFDQRLEPPKIQDDERLYYQPCAICKRPSNDPLCRCAAGLFR